MKINDKAGIIVIDSGVDIRHQWIKDADISGFSIVKGNNGYDISNDIEDNAGHGTAVCGILAKSIADARITVIKIYDKELTTDVETLVFALEYIDRNLECDIIHMSLGVLGSTKPLHDACIRLYKKGIILVSAFDNEGAVSYPAAYDEVIGVDVSALCTRSEDVIFLENNIVTVAGKGGNQRLAWVNPQFIVSQGASFTAPHITVLAAKLLKSGFNQGNILEELKKSAIKVIRCESGKREKTGIPFSMKAAAVFPCNKEVHGLINFADLLNFKLVDVYDTKYLGKINKTVKSIDCKKEFRLKSINDISYDNIDTMILGHMSELAFYSRDDIKKRIIEDCLKNNVNIYSFDSEHIKEYEEAFKARGLGIFYPAVKKSNYNGNKNGRLYHINAPVLGVYGTTDQQGKFTLQLQLRREFLKNKYRVGQLGTEPTALLFGMDDVYPFGYSSTVELEGAKAVEALNEMMHMIDSKEPDIILTGCQAGTVPMVFNNIVHLHVQQIEFLLGTLPDAVILCVNTYDSPEYIKRTISSIGNLVECRIIALAVSPLVYPNDWYMMNSRKKVADEKDIICFKDKIRETCGLPVFTIGDDIEAGKLYDTCIDFFSEK